LEISFDQQNNYNFRNLSGGLAVKFIFFMIKPFHPIDQTELMQISELPIRTVQALIGELKRLKRQRAIVEILDPKDARLIIYEPSSIMI
jgi:phosphosulfolactate synthase